MNATELYQAGQLSDAVSALNEVLKKNPTDQSARGFLAELLCFAGNVDRADKQLETLLQQTPEAAVGLSLFRQLIRAEQARQQFYGEGRLPEFLDEPSPMLRLHLQASIELREGNAEQVAQRLAEAEKLHPNVTGTCDGAAFEGFRDLDDLTAPVFEVLTSTGKYYWIPIDRVELVEFHAPERALDLLWRRAHMVVKGGPDGEVFLPAIYAGSAAQSDERLALGRATEWKGEEGAPAFGVGQRMFLVGEQDRPIMDITELTIDQPEE